MEKVGIEKDYRTNQWQLYIDDLLYDSIIDALRESKKNQKVLGFIADLLEIQDKKDKVITMNLAVSTKELIRLQAKYHKVKGIKFPKDLDQYL